MSSQSWTVGGDALTNFDPEQQHVYELAIERYAQIDPSHGFYIADAMPDAMGRPLPSLRALCRRQHGKDASDFWRVFDSCKKELGWQYPWQRRAAPSQPEGAEPVAEYQCRMRDIDGPHSDWGKWQKCSQVTHDAILRRPATAHFEYEARALYLHPSQSAGAAAPDEGEVRDAARYRWLRRPDTDLDALAQANWLRDGESGEVYSGSAFDSAIDIAMSTPKVKEGTP